MKSLLEEYGFAILTAIGVIILILMISPIGITIRDALLKVTRELLGNKSPSFLFRPPLQ